MSTKYKSVCGTVVEVIKDLYLSDDDNEELLCVLYIDSSAVMHVATEADFKEYFSRVPSAPIVYEYQVLIITNGIATVSKGFYTEDEVEFGRTIIPETKRPRQ